GLSMTDLYLSENPFGTGDVESHVYASDKTAIKPNVESSGNVSNKTGKSQFEKVDEETLIPENAKSGETLDVSRTNADATLEQSSMSVPV
ncbi:hypothetical protein A2U01_0081215, partial [Trifolium medium]|nr:hypothetical protein [Trifolium medium]